MEKLLGTNGLTSQFSEHHNFLLLHGLDLFVRATYNIWIGSTLARVREHHKRGEATLLATVYRRAYADRVTATRTKYVVKLSSWCVVTDPKRGGRISLALIQIEFIMFMPESERYRGAWRLLDSMTNKPLLPNCCESASLLSTVL